MKSVRYYTIFTFTHSLKILNWIDDLKDINVEPCNVKIELFSLP